VDTTVKKSAMHTGLYTIDPFHSFAGLGGRTEGYDALVTIAGLGGTGAFLAEDLARLLTVHFGWRAHFHLVDHDRVEIHNTQRQAFSRRDLDKYKAQVVAERLVRQFPIEVSVSLAPYDHGRDAPHRDGPRPRLALLIGCVDNPNARRELARTLEPMSYGGTANLWWLDLGNSASSGQLYLGNALRAEALRGTFDRETGICRALPAPCIQAPELLEAPAAPLPAALNQDCAEAQIAGDQEPFVNRTIAALGLAMVARLCQRRLTWRATFFDLDAGTLHYIHADPHDIANLMGMRTDSVLRGQRSVARARS
jgi:PRTRC genetic system ThiF family protein